MNVRRKSRHGSGCMGARLLLEIPESPARLHRGLVGCCGLGGNRESLLRRQEINAPLFIILAGCALKEHGMQCSRAFEETEIGTARPDLFPDGPFYYCN